MAVRSRVVSIQLDLEAQGDAVMVTFNRVRAGPRLTNRTYALRSQGSEMRLNDLVAESQVLIYDAIASRRGRLQLNVDVSQLDLRRRANDRP